MMEGLKLMRAVFEMSREGNINHEGRVLDEMKAYKV